MPEDRSKSIEFATLTWEPSYFEKDNVCSIEAIDLIKKLIEKKPEKRIGIKEIKQHPWFSSINWQLLEKGLIPPPFKPAKAINTVSESDIQTFKAVPNNVVVDQSIYKDWDFASTNSMEKEIVAALRSRCWPFINCFVLLYIKIFNN